MAGAKSVKQPKAAGGGGLAVFTGSFDPPTLGHLDLIARASRLFASVQVAVGEAQGKAALFDWQERLALLGVICAPFANVSVVSFSGLAAAFAVNQGASVLVRGLRSGVDLDYEAAMARMNQALAPGLETLFLLTAPSLSHISSSLAKDVGRHGGDLRLLVPANVAKAMQVKLQAAKSSSKK